MKAVRTPCSFGPLPSPPGLFPPWTPLVALPHACELLEAADAEEQVLKAVPRVLLREGPLAHVELPKPAAVVGQGGEGVDGKSPVAEGQDELPRNGWSGNHKSPRAGRAVRSPLGRLSY